MGKKAKGIPSFGDGGSRRVKPSEKRPGGRETEGDKKGGLRTVPPFPFFPEIKIMEKARGNGG